MKICILTQTATDISDSYKEFFKGKDLFFVTFKKPNDKAVAFVPGSTWSDGRNTLWDLVRDKYDYYIFIDDDLQFFKPKVAFAPLATYLSHKFLYKKHIKEAYKAADSEYFFARLEHHLTKFRPEVLGALCFAHSVTKLDMVAMRKNSFARRLGWFDAQFTVFSNYAASKMLPYDTAISGWWSSQIPVYLYAHNVFGMKSLAVSDIAVTNNTANGVYRPGYDGFQDCKNMLSAISSVTGKDFTNQFRPETVVNTFYGEQGIIARLPKPDDKEDYAANFEQNLKGLENLIHPNLAF